jgi:hypothetical protein
MLRMVTYREQNGGTVLPHKEVNKPSENSAVFKYYGMTLTNEN